MPTALVLSAGGMFAAWEVGVWKFLRERVQIDLVVGASAGALNGWAIAGGCTAGDLAAEWMDPRTASLMRSKPMHEKARELFSRFQPRIPFGLTVVEIPSLRLRLMRDSEITWQHLAASCAIPLAFPPVRIDGARYVDGGLRGALPLWAAEEMGATRAIAVNALTIWPFRWLHRAVRPRQPSNALDVIRIEPSETLGSLRDAVVWGAGNIARWISLGERDANQALRSITM